ncbi:MAG: serine/threonine-protein kinase [Gemmatimonadota bacterium]
MERELGHGGMATVYLAHDLKHDRDVALKVLRPELAALLGRDRFLTEIRLTAKLDHPNILTLIDSGEAEGALYYVLPYVRGESLRHRLKQERQLPLEEAIRIATQIASALDYAHRQGVIHRDIKPENILLHEGVAMVMDFGIALAFGDVGAERLTETGLSLGTPEYMSPEQAAGDRQVDARTDVYALAAVSYEMLAGEAPFSGPTRQAILARMMTQRPVPLSALRDTVSSGAEAAVLKGLSRSPADRYPSTREFAAALVQASPQPASGRRAVTGVLLLLLLGAVSFGLWRWQRTTGGSASGEPLKALWDVPLEHQRIAVLYLRAEGDDPGLAFVANGLTEGLIDSLRQSNQLDVVPGAKTDSSREAHANPDSVARLLQVETLVDGSVRKVGDRFRISLQLVDGQTGIRSVSRELEGSLQDLVPIQGELASSVVVMLKAKPRNLAESGPGAVWIAIQEARRLLATGDSLVDRGDTVGAPSQYARADSLARKAIALDARSVDGWVLRATIAYRQSRVAGDNTRLIQAWSDSGLSEAEMATALAPHHPDALVIRGTLRYWRWLNQLERDSAKASALLLGAQSDLETATSLAPKRADAWAVLSHLYYQTKGSVEVERAAAKAYEANPYLRGADRVLNRLFFSSYDLNDFPSASRWCTTGHQRFPADHLLMECSILLMTMKDGSRDVSLAWRIADSATVLAPKAGREFATHYHAAILGAVLARAGLGDSARRVLSRSRATAKLDPSSDIANVAAFGYTLLGDRAEAIDQLRRVLASNPERRASLEADPGWWFQELRDEPGFRRLVGGR